MTTRLYRHALESIFSHLNLSELGRISATCRDWSTFGSALDVRLSFDAPRVGNSSRYQAGQCF